MRCMLVLMGALVAIGTAAAQPSSPPRTERPPSVARLRITVTNPTDEPWVEAPVTLKVDPAWNLFGSQSRPALIGADVLPVQQDDLDHDGKIDECSFLVPLGPRQSKTCEISTLGSAEAAGGGPAPTGGEGGDREGSVR